MADITAIILTFNEEKNLKKCIDSIKGICRRIVVIDSFSTDATVSIAKQLGAEVYQHEFVNQALQYNYGVEVADVKTKWVMRLDADERLTLDSADEIEQICRQNNDSDVNGIVVRFKVNFLGRDLRHGGIYPFKKLIVYKKDKGHMEVRHMDEHIVIEEGRVEELENDSIHEDFKDLTTWIDKHNKYSSREVLDYLETSEQKEAPTEKGARLKRFIKYNIYYRLPLGTRAHLYYLYRYYMRFGFLDGKEGRIFAFMQAYWYRYLVDAKIYEQRRARGGKK